VCDNETGYTPRARARVEPTTAEMVGGGGGRSGATEKAAAVAVAVRRATTARRVSVGRGCGEEEIRKSKRQVYARRHIIIPRRPSAAVRSWSPPTTGLPRDHEPNGPAPHAYNDIRIRKRIIHVCVCV